MWTPEGVPLPKEEKALTKALDAGLSQRKEKHLKGHQLEEGKMEVDILLQLFGAVPF